VLVLDFSKKKRRLSFFRMKGGEGQISEIFKISEI